MGLETGTYISDLNTANPVGTDAKSQGDDHIRFLKATIKATFPNITGAVTKTQAQLNSTDAETLGGVAAANFLQKSGGTMTGNLSIINSTTQMSITLGSSTGYFYGDATNVGWYKAGAGNFQFTIATGNFTASGNVTAYSDMKLKKDLEVIPNALDKVSQLTGYTYTRIDTGERQAGLVAQDVQKVLPEVVIETKEGTLSLAYGNLVGLLVEAIKELKAEIEELKK